MSKLRTEAAPESNREGAVWCMQRKQHTQIQRQESMRFVWGTASACLCCGGPRELRHTQDEGKDAKGSSSGVE